MTTLNYTNVISEKITFEKYKELLLVKYESKPLLIQTPWLNINAFGMPRRDKYHTTDDQLKNIHLPIDNEEFKKLIQSIDNTINTDEFRKEHLGDKYEKYAYHTMLVEKENKPSSIKFKFSTTRDEKQDILTLLYKTLEKKGNIERTLIDKPTIDDFIKNIPYRSDVRCIFQIVRMWSQPSTLKNPTYGLTLKLHKIEVKEKAHHNIVGEFIDVECFDISSDEEQPLNTPNNLYGHG